LQCPLRGTGAVGARRLIARRGLRRSLGRSPGSRVRSELAVTTPDLAALPRLPRDAEGPVFKAPWEAQAFGMAVTLSERGLFTWKEWATYLAGEEPAARLAPRAVVRLVLGVDDALHRGAARRARLAVAPVDGHPFAERRDPLGELRTGLPPQPFAPVEQRRARGLEEARALRV